MKSVSNTHTKQFRLIDHIIELAHGDPSRPALLTCDISGNVVEEISRSALLQKIEEAGAYLQSEGLRAGDRVALEFENCAELLILSWASWSLGIVTVPLDTKRDTDKLREYKIRKSEAKILITKDIFKKAAPSEICKIPWMQDSSHEALILFTSGTTAYPKGAQLTLQNLIVNAEGIIEWLRIKEDDRFLVQLPLHHINSTTFCLASLIAGAAIAIPPTYSNSRFWEQAANSGATLMSVVPSIIFDQLTRTKEFDMNKDRIKLARIQLGSAPVVVRDALEFMRKFSIPIYQGYGQTETSLRVTGMPMDLPEDAYEKRVAENSIGTPMKWAHIEIADAEGHVLGEKQEGELIISGNAVMQGYIGGEPAFRDGYFLTGDIGYWKKIDGQRFFFLVGRSKEIIIKGGVNISPVAVENALKKISPDIEQTFVVGVVDERYGEEVGAVIVWRNGTEPMRAMRRLKFLLLVRHETLRTYEIPKFVAAVRAEELPMTSTGKVQRVILRKNIVEDFESLYELMHSDDFRFEIIPSQSTLVEKSLSLYNHCWQPLIKTPQEYKKYLEEFLTLGAIDTSGVLAGQISFSYENDTLTCVSICSATFKPKPTPKIKNVPGKEKVRRYLLEGNDPVMNFHHKLGAELVEVIPGGRPEDASSLGYTMLLRYPNIDNMSIEGPVSNQLIAVVRLLAHDLGAKTLAVSRPGGLAAYFSKNRETSDNL